MRGELTIPNEKRVFEHQEPAITIRHRLADLMWAIQKDDLESIKSMDISCLNELSAEGSTPLHLASKLGRTSIVKHLLAQGAFVFSRTSGPSGSHTPLFYAQFGGHQEVVDLLVTCGAHLTSYESNRPEESND